VLDDSTGDAHIPAALHCEPLARDAEAIPVEKSMAMGGRVAVNDLLKLPLGPPVNVVRDRPVAVAAVLPVTQKCGLQLVGISDADFASNAHQYRVTSLNAQDALASDAEHFADAHRWNCEMVKPRMNGHPIE